MFLKEIKTDTNLHIVEVVDGKETDVTYKGVFTDLVSDRSFFVRSIELYNAFPQMGDNTELLISFFRGDSICTFSGKADRVIIKNGMYLTLIEQASDIVPSSRRKYQREEMMVNVLLYDLKEDRLNSPPYTRSGLRVVFSSDTFDISAGGLCLVSNSRIRNDVGPYFLVEFSLSKGKDTFLLPGKVVRKSNSPQMPMYKYDYGIQFIYDKIPNERKRLVNALFNAKFSAFNR